MKTIKKIIIILATVALLFLVTTRLVQGYNKAIEINLAVQSEQALQDKINAMSIPELIDYLATENATQLKKVAWCESSYNPKAIGDGGKAKNILQFHEPTFSQFSKEMGEPLNYDSAYDQIKLANYMWNKGKQHHWTCYKKVI